jgi:hypothetical protein
MQRQLSHLFDKSRIRIRREKKEVQKPDSATPQFTSSYLHVMKVLHVSPQRAGKARPIVAQVARVLLLLFCKLAGGWRQPACKLAGGWRRSACQLFLFPFGAGVKVLGESFHLLQTHLKKEKRMSTSVGKDRLDYSGGHG